MAIWLPQRSATVDARVVKKIQTNPTGALAARTMVVTLNDGRIYPVNYLREGNLVFMGIDGFWWRAFEGAGQPVALLIKNEQFTGIAQVVRDDQAYVDDVFARLRPKVPDWLPDSLNGKLVVITLGTEDSLAVPEQLLAD